MIVTRDIVWRNPFTRRSLPLLLRLYRRAYAPATRLRHHLGQFPFRQAFRLAYGLGFGGRVGASVTIGGSEKTLDLRARNLQFGSLYMPQSSQGAEPETAALIDLFAGDEGGFFDIGSNWGYYSVYLCSRRSYTGKVDAFEPMPETFADLKSVIEQTGLQDRITPHKVALSDRAGEARMTVPDGIHSGLARLTAGGSGVRVALTPLDTLSLTPPAVIKLDVEDHEAEVIEGAEKLLRSAKPMIIFESWLHQDPAKTLKPFDALESAGYRFFQPGWLVESDGHRSVAPEQTLTDGQKAPLALLPFEADQRCAMRGQFNVLACHKDKLDHLRSLFK